MAAVTAAMVKELRERTGLGMMDCKKALVESDGDMDLAIDNLRKSSGMKAAKKASRTAADGLIRIQMDGTQGLMVEVNCETDFAAKDDNFINFADQVNTVSPGYAEEMKTPSRIEIFNREKNPLSIIHQGTPS